MLFYSLTLILILSPHFNSINGEIVNEIYRLPKNIKPARYTLTIDISELKSHAKPVPYNGSVVIEILSIESSNTITLHKRRLQIDEDTISVTDSNGVNIKVTSTSENSEEETYTIHLEKELEQNGNYKLTIGNFHNTLGFRNVGFYLAKYQDYNKVERRLAVTDFEPTDAREAFPCFDEPAIKSKFIINIIRTEEYHSVSNEALENTVVLGDGRFKDTFKETPDMSVYVVAFVVSDHKFTSKVGKHTIYGRKDDIERGRMEYALDISSKTLKHLEEYTGTEYSLSKLDQYAVPDEYFKDDAMENWGLIIYGESHLLCHTASAATDLKRCTGYIAHEFAHQWFGNLVTPQWWDYTWLAESFAAYFQYYIGSLVQPEWRFMDQFVIDNLHKAFLEASPLTYPIKSSGSFPPLNVLYCKGSSIIRMMAHFLTPEILQKGLRNYLQDRKYNSAVPSDLYKALQMAIDSAGTNYLVDNNKIADILGTWETNKAFPLVTVTRDYATGKIILEQHPYTWDGLKPVEKSWFIPINTVFQSENDDQPDFSNTTAEFWLTETKKTLESNYPKDGWLIVNKQQTGYYRVNYDEENWERIIRFMKSPDFKAIHVLNRAQLINDAFALARTKLISWEVPIRLCEYLVQEKDYIPFAAFYESISRIHTEKFQNGMYMIEFGFHHFRNHSSINTVSSGDDDEEAYQDYVKSVLSGLREYLGFESKPTDSFCDTLNRPTFTEWLCNFGDPDCNKYATEKLREVKAKNTVTVSPDMENVIYKTALGTTKASPDEWVALFNVYNASTDIHQRMRLRDALGHHTSSYEHSDWFD